MSLPAEERLQEALDFLQGLDLKSIMEEVEATLSPQGIESSASKSAVKTAPGPLNVSLISLSALPTARNATILHAKPSDPTSRLYPFCNRLRDKFIEAGFMLQDTTRAKDDNKGTEGNEPGPGRSNDPDERRETEPKQQNHGTKPRPLLLHATVANTIYMGRRRQAGGKRDTYKFDARDLLSKFRNYHGDNSGAEGTNIADPKGMDARDEAQKEQSPFIWAREFPLESLSICEMGAKDIPEEYEAKQALLGQEYIAVGERKLDFSGELGS
jgi:activating signal cointegrator complex subunit 1